MSYKHKNRQNTIDTIVDLSLPARKHDEALKFMIKESCHFTKYRKYTRPIIKLKSENNVTLLIKQNERTLLGDITLNAEAILYLMSLDGCPQKLFYYILFFELDYKTGVFLFNASVIKKFTDFCKRLNLDYKESAIKQAIKQLSANNIVLSIKRGKYKVNPMIAGGNSKHEKIKLTCEYSLNLLDKRKDFNSIYAKTHNA